MSIEPNPDLIGLGGRGGTCASCLVAAAEAKHHERMLKLVSDGVVATRRSRSNSSSETSDAWSE
jgi:hypothetical protein